jgi:hypothetical protein
MAPPTAGELGRINLDVSKEIFSTSWSRLPDWVRKMSDITWMVKGVYLYLMSRVREQGGGKCYPAIQTIADNIGISRTTAKKALHRLVEKDLIRSHRTKSGVSYYTFCPPPRLIMTNKGMVFIEQPERDTELEEVEA